jgi:hypothetical protein
MPIDPRYKFTNSQADLAGNGGGAFQAGMGLWGGPQPEPIQRATPYIPSGITPDVIQAARMGRQQPQPQQPIAPVAPVSPRQPMQAPQTQMTEQDLPPEMPQPEMNLGYGNIEDIPTNEGLDNTPQSDKHTDLQNQELQRFEQTKLARQGSEMGMDPRQLYVALAQFSAGMGNIKGKDTRSTAADFYNMQKGYEAQDEARKMRQEEFAARMAPKPVDPLDIAQKQATIEYLKRKGMPQPAAPLDPMKQKLTEAQIANLNARTKNELLGSQRGMPTTKGTSAPTIGAVSQEEVVQVPGWQKTQNVPIEKAELKQFRDRSAKVPRVIEKIEKLKSLITKYGAYENPYGEAGVLMRQLNNDLKLDLKGPEFKALGVLAGPDMAILEALIPDPSSWQNAMRGDKSVTRSLDALKDNLQKDIEAGGRQLGFTRESAAAPVQAAPTGSTGLPVYRPGGK